MNIENISKTQQQATIVLSKDELVLLCNIMFKYGIAAGNNEEAKTDLFNKTYADMIIARDMCQYGHIDNFALSSIMRARNSCCESPEGILSDEDIDTFNAYLESNDMKTAFGNSDFRRIYKKITGFHGPDRSQKIQEWLSAEKGEYYYGQR